MSVEKGGDGEASTKKNGEGGGSDAAVAEAKLVEEGGDGAAAAAVAAAAAAAAEEEAYIEEGVYEEEKEEEEEYDSCDGMDPEQKRRHIEKLMEFRMRAVHDNQIYIGQWGYGLPHGDRGSMYSSGERYIGDFVAGVRKGNGRVVNSYSSYMGQFGRSLGTHRSLKVRCLLFYVHVII